MRIKKEKMNSGLFHNNKVLQHRNKVINYKIYTSTAKIYNLQTKLLEQTIEFKTPMYRIAYCEKTDVAVCVPASEMVQPAILVSPIIEIYKLSPMELKKKLNWESLSVFDVVISNNGSFFLASIEESAFVILYDLKKFHPTTLTMNFTCANCIAISDNELHCTASDEEYIFIWTVTGQLVAKMAQQFNLIDCKFFPNSDALACLCDHNIFVWKFTDKDSAIVQFPCNQVAEVWVSETYQGAYNLDISSDEKYILMTISADDAIYIFDTENRTRLRKIGWNGLFCNSFASFSMDSTKVFFSTDNEICRASLFDFPRYAEICHASLFDFARYAVIALMLRRCQVAPYLVLDILNYLICNMEKSCFESESTLLRFHKISAITRLL